MNQLATHGVLVAVQVYYQEAYSNPLMQEYLFAYKITVTNFNDFAVQLLRRHWKIFDSNGTYSDVRGDGVIGVQPILQPGDAYEYRSGCNLRTEMGKMLGTYTMLNMANRQEFTVAIPAFELFAPMKGN